MRALVPLLPQRLLLALLAYGLDIAGHLVLELTLRVADHPRVGLRDLAHLEAAVAGLARARDCVEAFAGLRGPVEGVRWVAQP